jgi:hypothetical protein
VSMARDSASMRSTAAMIPAVGSGVSVVIGQFNHCPCRVSRIPTKIFCQPIKPQREFPAVADQGRMLAYGALPILPQNRSQTAVDECPICPFSPVLPVWGVWLVLLFSPVLTPRE